MSEARLFDARADAIGSIRDHVQQSLLRHGAGDEAIDAAVLCASELATNALLHGEGPIGVELDIRAERARVVVHDRNTAPPVLQRPRPDDDAGRGLLLVGLFTDLWGVEPRPDGKAVWFEIDLRERGALRDEAAGGERRRWGQRAANQAW